MILRVCIASTTLLFSSIAFAESVVECRLDHQYDNTIKATAERALSSLKASKKNIGIDQVQVNPASNPVDANTLSIYVISNAPADAVDTQGCATRKFVKGDLLDKLSVRGACFVKSVDKRSIQCASEALRIFAYASDNEDRVSPALLYVLTHEIGHIYQKRTGEYSGQVLALNLSSDPAKKLAQLRARCTPTMTEQEEQADEYSLDVLRTSLMNPPYREAIFSEQGSLFWNIDLLALAADKWAQASAEREFMSQAPMHNSFEPSEFPTPLPKIKIAAKQLVCDVIKKNKGVVSVPAISSTHPPAEQRLRRIAEVLKPAAQALPRTGGSQQYKAVARLQQDLSPIFTHIYRETGVYMEALEAEICTLVNAPEPMKACK